MSGIDTPATTAEPVAHPLAFRLAEELTGRDPAHVLLLGIGSGRNIAPLLACGMLVDALDADDGYVRAAQRRFASDDRVRIERASYAGPFFDSPGERASTRELPVARDRYVAALSTHALLHGVVGEIAAAVAAVGARLAAGAPFHATLGSTSDRRYGRGRHIEATTFAPTGGSERGVAHTYFDEGAARLLFAAFKLDELREHSAAESAGRWAHSADEAAHMVHWFVRARRL